MGKFGYTNQHMTQRAGIIGQAKDLIPYFNWGLRRRARLGGALRTSRLVSQTTSQLFIWFPNLGCCFDSELSRWMWLVMEEVVKTSVWKMKISCRYIGFGSNRKAPA